MICGCRNRSGDVVCSFVVRVISVGVPPFRKTPQSSRLCAPPFASTSLTLTIFSCKAKTEHPLIRLNAFTPLSPPSPRLQPPPRPPPPPQLLRPFSFPRVGIGSVCVYRGSGGGGGCKIGTGKPWSVSLLTVQKCTMFALQSG